MEKLLIFDSAKEVRFGKLLKFIIPTYLTALFNTVYTIVDGIFVSSYVGTNALAAINIVYPIVNILTGIALAFATGGSALAALHIGGERKEEANRTFSVSMLLSLLVGCGVSALIWIKLPALYAYNNLMKFLDFGYGSAMAVMIFIIVFIISLIYMKVMGNQLVE